MQKLVIVLFAAALLLKPVLPVVDYAVNYKYISENLCINKDKKNLHCNGKCHLKNKLADASETTEKNLPDKKLKSHQAELLFCTEIAGLNLRQPEKINLQTADRYNDRYSFTGSDGHFHPPSRA